MMKRHHTTKRMSQIVEYPLSGSMVVLAGQVASDPDAGIKEQTRSVLERIDQLLSEADTDKSSIVSAQIWLASISDFDEMNEVWDEWIVAGNAPARACVEARLADPRLRVEIQVSAIR